MMLSQRKEHFRFSFGTPLSAAFCIVKKNEHKKEEFLKSSAGAAKILDISPDIRQQIINELKKYSKKIHFRN